MGIVVHTYIQVYVCVYMHACVMKRSHLLVSLYIVRLKVTFTIDWS